MRERRQAASVTEVNRSLELCCGVKCAVWAARADQCIVCARREYKSTLSDGGEVEDDGSITSAVLLGCRLRPHRAAVHRKIDQAPSRCVTYVTARI